MSKLDLLNSKSRKHIERFLDPEMDVLLAEELNNCPVNSRYEKLNHAIAGLVGIKYWKILYCIIICSVHDGNRSYGNTYSGNYTPSGNIQKSGTVTFSNIGHIIR